MSELDTEARRTGIAAIVVLQVNLKTLQSRLHQFAAEMAEVQGMLGRPSSKQPSCGNSWRRGKEVMAMEVEFFDSLEEAQARLRQAMEAADARVKPWQAAVKVGDCFIADGGEEDLVVFGEVLEG